VTGHQAAKGWAIVDAGWMAMSRDRGTQKQKQDYGYGQVCTVAGVPITGCIMSGANQEHGIVSFADGAGVDVVERFPIGMRLRILPNHACSTATQFDEYRALGEEGVLSSWPRIRGW
jgi:D-serine deaminase-like pyridoxal phosphate-dependent protein